MQLRLEPITSENWRKAIKLQVADEQKGFVAPNYYSIIEALYEPNDLFCFAVYDGDEMVGFTMHGSDPDDTEHRYWIVRLMVDIKHQGKGYGRAIMQQLIDTLKQGPTRDAIYISFEPSNDVARALYSSLGFIDTGTMLEGETVYKLPLKENVEG